MWHLSRGHQAKWQSQLRVSEDLQMGGGEGEQRQSTNSTISKLPSPTAFEGLDPILAIGQATQYLFLLRDDTKKPTASEPLWVTCIKGCLSTVYGLLRKICKTQMGEVTGCHRGRDDAGLGGC